MEYKCSECHWFLFIPMASVIYEIKKPFVLFQIKQAAFGVK